MVADLLCGGGDAEGEAAHAVDVANVARGGGGVCGGVVEGGDNAVLPAGHHRLLEDSDPAQVLHASELVAYLTYDRRGASSLRSCAAVAAGEPSAGREAMVRSGLQANQAPAVLPAGSSANNPAGAESSGADAAVGGYESAAAVVAADVDGGGNSVQRIRCNTEEQPLWVVLSWRRTESPATMDCGRGGSWSVRDAIAFRKGR